jgi:hypothetical protein
LGYHRLVADPFVPLTIERILKGQERGKISFSFCLFCV